MNVSEAMFYENYLTSDFHTNTSFKKCLPTDVKMASKTVIRPIVGVITMCSEHEFFFFNKKESPEEICAEGHTPFFAQICKCEVLYIHEFATNS